MCIFFRIMCVCCRQEEKTSAGNDNTPSPEAQRVPPVTLPPRLQPPLCSSTANECFAEEDKRTKFPPEQTIVRQEYPKLQDYGSSDDLKQLTVKEMKILLTMNRVDFKGCIEKIDLLEKVNRLWEDSARHKGTPETTPTEELCKLCMDAPLDCVLLECGHIASCVECGKKLAECPICRQYVVRVVRTFKA